MFLLYSFFILTGILLSESWSRDTKYCTIEGTIELCAPLEVKGVQGEDVIIPCRFRHNKGGDIKELGLVFKKYYNYKQDVIFNSSSKYTDGRFKGRIQTVGNPSEGDGSVRIRDLKMEDEGMYGCRFVFYQWGRYGWKHVGFEPRSWKRTKVQVDGSRIHNPYKCTMEGTKKLCVQRKVIGVHREAVVLPCLFNHNEGNSITDLRFLLYKYYNSRYNVIFDSSTNDTHERFKGRIQSLGNPSEGDGSVRIKDLKKEDKGRYKCVFEFDQWEGFWNQWKRVRFEPRPRRRTKVQVDESEIHNKDNCTMEGTKKLCVQHNVIGVQGEAVILPCLFNHNERNNITDLSFILYKYYNNSRYNMIINSSTNDTDVGFKERIQTVGNPSEGDGSVRIRDLKKEDEGTYGCRCEFREWRSWWSSWHRVGFEAREGKQTRLRVDESEIHNKDNCTMEGTKKLCVQHNVIGVQGEAVILPCMFNDNEGNNITDLNFVLYKYYSSRYNVINNSSTNDTDGGFKGRIQTVGNPSEGNGSVRIRDLKMEDEGTYMCRCEFREWRSLWSSWHHAELEAREGKQTRLRVDVSPKILRIWKDFVNSSTSWRLFCEAEAKPRPNITWWNPLGHLLDGNEMKENTHHQNESQIIISSYNITGEDPGGNYSCLVQNQHGTVKRFVFSGAFEGTSETRGITGIVIGCSTALILVLLLLIVFGFLIYKKKRNPAEGTDTHGRMDSNQEEEEAEITYATLAVLPHKIFPAPEHSPDTSIYAVIKR